MGYQALLFCPDEKLARVVSQVFTELDFSIEPVHEPFAAVKKLMSQRYDAIVVDCENEQNASLLFKSARNSSSNQSSLAIAVVEGQAGVAKAYRIGANLVLTKPINVEQAKGTLRVARGLLRKNQDAAAVNVAAPALSTTKISEPAAAAPQAKPVETRIPATPPQVTKNSAYETGPLTISPAVPAAVSAVMSAASAPSDKASVSTPKPIPPVVAHAAEVSNSNSASAAAPALAKVATPEAVSPKVDENAAQSQTFRNAAHSAPEFEAYESAPVGGSAVAIPQVAISAPSFGVPDEAEPVESKGSKKFLIAACLLVLAVLGYFAYQKFGGSALVTAVADRSAQQGAHPVASQASSAQLSDQQPASAQPVTSTLAPVAPTASSAHSASTSKASPAKTSSGIAENTVKVIADSGVDQPAITNPKTNISAATPVRVKSNIAASKGVEEVAPPSSSSFAVTSDNKLTGLMDSTPAVLPKPTLSNVRVSQGVSQGLLIKRVAPKYPAAARSTHTQGEVRIEATVNKEGMVVNPKVTRGDLVLAHAALEAVRQWRYKPYYLDGQPVEIQTEITINFKAD